MNPAGVTLPGVPLDDITLGRYEEYRPAVQIAIQNQPFYELIEIVNPVEAVPIETAPDPEPEETAVKPSSRKKKGG